ncbi:alkaline phosphatase [Terrimonas sp.]|uniref:alkaline phosphatase n=1 Tax=Terrimonas sp. TaxID=1914338 RepID=UPI000D5108CA|nr:alkaline phosphatase [Terrimonas sp.]PVD52922.1 alkaline phosphatase [Terrimonas sp.]
MKKLLSLLLFFIVLNLQLNAQHQKVKHVVLIGCDGLGAYALPDADMPELKKLMLNGAWSLQARSVLPSSSAVNWASMLMGAGPTVTGYTEWDSKTPEIPSAVKGPYNIFPGIFGILKQQKAGERSAVIYNWGGIGYLFERAAVDIIVHNNQSGGDFFADTAAIIIKTQKPTLTFLHLSEPDGVGHNIGHGTEAYYEELKRVDRRIGRVVNAIKEAGIENETIIIVTSDHGGKGKGHGGKSLDEIQIPWIISGVGIKRGHKINDIIITYDTAATIAYILGLKTPQPWRGKAVTDAFK